MNKVKWGDVAMVTLGRYTFKLTEEVGEVAKEISDLRADANPSEHSPPSGKANLNQADKHLARMATELEHVIFIAEQMGARVRMERQEIKAARKAIYGD